MAELQGPRQCGVSPSDRRLADCRGRVTGPDDLPLLLTAALVDGHLAILVLRGALGEEGLTVWYRALASRFGWVTSTHDRGQDTWQWVRRGQMIRLTTREDRGARMVSVTLVDGPLLDGLGSVP